MVESHTCADEHPVAPRSFHIHRQAWKLWQASLVGGSAAYGIVVPGFPLGHDAGRSVMLAMTAYLIGQALMLPMTLLAFAREDSPGVTRNGPLYACALVGLVPALALVPIGLVFLLFPKVGQDDGMRGWSRPVTSTIGFFTMIVAFVASALTTSWHDGLVVAGVLGLGTVLVVGAWAVTGLVRAVGREPG